MFAARKRGIQFTFQGCPKANKISIDLDLHTDTYMVMFWQITPKDWRMIHTFADVYAERLAPIFEEFTGLYLTL